MRVYLVRHASAGEAYSDPKKDEKRPLDEQGVTQCREVGHALAALEVHVDLVISSPLKRAAQTASMVANEIGYEGRIVFDDALRPGTGFTDFRELTRRHAALEAIMVVGHNPNLSAFLGTLIGSAHQAARIDMKKGAVACVDWDRRGYLAWYLTPKVVRALRASGKK